MIKQITKWVSSDGTEWSTQEQAQRREMEIHLPMRGAQWAAEQMRAKACNGAVIALASRKMIVAEAVTSFLRCATVKMSDEQKHALRFLCHEHGEGQGGLSMASLLTPAAVLQGALKGKTLDWVWIDGGFDDRDVMNDIAMALHGAPDSAMLITGF